jgi:hypothetical protein
MLEFIEPLYNWLQQFKNHILIHCHLPTGHTRLLTIMLYSVVLLPKVKVKVTLRLTVSQSASLCVELHLGLMTRYLLLLDSYGLVFVGRSL